MILNSKRVIRSPTSGYRVIHRRIDRRCLYQTEDRKINSNEKVSNSKQLHRDRRSLVPILYGKITECDVVSWWFAAVVAVVACLIITPIYCGAGSDLPKNATEYIANPMGSRPCSQKRPCTAVCERRATASLTPFANRAERAMLL